MTGARVNFKELFGHRLSLLKELELLLKDLLKENRDRSWGVSGLKEIEGYFGKLRSLDESQNQLIIESPNIMYERESMELMVGMENLMKSIRNLLITYQIRLEGGKQLVGNKLKEVMKGKDIKGYKTILT